MKRVLFLAWRYVAYHKVKSAILTICLTLTIVLPLSAQLLIAHYDQALKARAATTPLVVGAQGNRFDLVLKALYFGSAEVEPVSMAELDALEDSGLGLSIPLHLGFTARRHPIVGTTLDYFEFRRLVVRVGTLPLRLGQAVLGADVAAELQLGPGDHLFSDQQSIYDITKTYPLKMRVVGVLEKAGTPDDRAVFIDIKTAWIIAGISHGHQDVVEEVDQRVILQRSESEVKTNASIVEYNEVTPDNIDSFHTHASPAELPLSAIIVVPADDKSATILKARYDTPGRVDRMLEPAEVVRELMERVFEVQRIFNASFALIAVSTLLFLTLVVLLSQRIRQREMETMFKIGCSRSMTIWLQTAELVLVLVMSVVLAGVLSAVVLLAVPHFITLVSA